MTYNKNQLSQFGRGRVRGRSGRNGTFASALLLGGLLPVTAFAQTAAPVDAANAEAVAAEPAMATGPDEIVVTAQKRSESANKVGMSIAAFSGDALINRGVGSPADLVKIVPGFSFAKTPRSAPVFTLRGIGFFDDALAGAPTVSVYTDEVPLPFSYMTSGAALDLERVEVLKGPQGTVFGSNATGGAINYIAAKPTNDLAYGADLSFGRFNNLEASAFVSGPLSSTLKARVAVKTEQADGWQVSQSRPSDRLGQRDRLLGRILLDWEPSPDVSFALNVNAWRDKSDTQAAQYLQTNFAVPPFGAPELIGLPAAPRNNRVADWDPGEAFRLDNEFFQISLRGNYDLSDAVRLVSISAYSHFKLDSRTDMDGTQFFNFRFAQNGKIDSYFQELRAEINPVSDLDLLIGANYQNDRVRDNGYTQVNISSFRAALGSGMGDGTPTNRTKIETYAFFGNAEYRITPELKLLGGIRYTNSKNDTSVCTFDGGMGATAQLQSNLLGLATPIPAGGCITSINGTPGISNFKIYEDNISWRTGLNWQATPDILLYANVSRGYKAGGVPQLFAFNANQLRPVTQESLLAYEVGAKMTLLNNTLQLNGALFYYDYTDKQLKSRVPVVPIGNLESTINIPKSRVQGAELQITWVPVSGLTLSGGGTYVDSRIGAGTLGFNGFGTPTDLSGEAFPLTPKWQLTADAEYDRPVSDSLNAYIGGSMSYQSRAYSLLGQLELLKIDPYTLFDLRFGVHHPDDKWRIGGFVRNVTNKYYNLLRSPVADTAIIFAGQPRTYGITASVRY